MLPFSTTDVVIEFLVIVCMWFVFMYFYCFFMQFAFGHLHVVDGRLRSSSGWKRWARRLYAWFAVTTIAYISILALAMFKLEDYRLQWFVLVYVAVAACGAVILVVNLAAKSPFCYPSRLAEWLLVAVSLVAIAGACGLLWSQDRGLYVAVALSGGAVVGFVLGLVFLRMQKFVPESDAEPKRPNCR